VNDHDTVIVLVEQVRQHDVQLTEHDEAIDRLRMSRVQFHATAVTISAIVSVIIPVVIKMFWPHA